VSWPGPDSSPPDRLLDAVQERLRRFRGSGQAEEILGPGSSADADALLRQVTRGDADAGIAALRAVGLLYYQRYLLLPDGPDRPELARAVRVLEPVWTLAPQTVPELIRRMLWARSGAWEEAGNGAATAHQVALGLMFLVHESGDEAAARAAIILLRRELAAAPDESRQRVRILNVLGNALRAWWKLTGDLTALTESVEVNRQAVGALPDDDPDKPGLLHNLSNALRAQWRATADQSLLFEAVQVSREAVDRAPAGSPHRGMFLNTLGLALRAWWQATGNADILTDAVAVARSAVAVLPDDHPDRGAYLNNLGTALQHLSARTGEIAALEEAITVCRDSVARTPVDHPDYSPHVDNLSGALYHSWRAGNAAARSERSGLLAEAIRLERAAADAVPPDHPARAGYLSNLASYLRSWWEISGEANALDEAIRCGRQALDRLAHGDPDRAIALHEYGMALRARAESARGHAEAARVEARDALREAARMASAPVHTRIAAARSWGQIEAPRDWAAAFEAHTLAVTLLRRLAVGNPSRPDQAYQISQYSGLTSDAAACALNCGQLSAAVQLLERGRGLILTRGLDQAFLRRSAPDIADRLDALQDQLGARQWAPQHSTDAPGADDRGGTGRHWHRLSQAWDELAATIRQLPGLENFDTDVAVDQLVAEISGFAVIVNVSQYRSDAVIITAGTCRAVMLPDVTPETVIEQVAALLGSLTTLQRPDAASAALDAAERSITGVLSWLWTHITGPVLDNLGLTTPPPSQPWPRVRWCPTGPLSLLPLHAAADPRLEDGAVLDRVISSYTPTMRALLSDPRPTQADPSGTPGPLVVTLRHAGDADELAGADAELAEVLMRFPDAPRLVGPDATREKVLDALGRQPWVHFACHAVGDFEAPTGGRLLLHDGPVTLEDIAERVRGQSAEGGLALLLACETARGALTVADEGIHIASGFRLAGYQNVIACLWPVSDPVAVRMVHLLYNATRESALLLPADTATILHQAVRHLRRRHRGFPSLWAPFIHLGAR
jgi:tetratricopeptide (TPR) repeat protein